MIGIFALVLFGPRKLPEMARKLGSMMTEFRRVSNDFRSTWEDAIALEETKETKKIESKESLDEDFELENTISQNSLQLEAEKPSGEAALPEVREVSKEEFEELIEEKTQEIRTEDLENTEEVTNTKPEKTSWL